MISVLESEAVLDTARLLNRRDALRLDQEIQAEDKENRCLRNPPTLPAHLDKTDEEFWASTPGVTGLKNSHGEPYKRGESYYSWGPYPRNRRILADVALAAGWDVEKARILERRCINDMLGRLKSFYKAVDVSGDQPTKDGFPYTFQHISWSDLGYRIKREVREIDPSKLAMVKAAVLDCYTANSKAMDGGKRLPRLRPGDKRISDDVPVGDSDIKRAQVEIDTEERRKQAYQMCIFDKKYYMSPERVKGVVKAFLNGISGRIAISKEEFCDAINVTEEELDAFLTERKREPLMGSKAFHNALAYIRKRGKEQQQQQAGKIWIATEGETSPPSNTSGNEPTFGSSSSGSASGIIRKRSRSAPDTQQPPTKKHVVSTSRFCW